MRFYSFTNYYLSSIQQGIQPGHAAVDLLVKYSRFLSDGQTHLAWMWAEKHKTFVCLNGGNNASLQELWAFFDDVNNPYPYVAFHEDEQSLGGVMTSIGIVLPAKIYDTASAERTAFRSSVFQRVEDRFVGSTVESNFTWIAMYTDSEGIYVEHLFTDWEHDLVLKLNEFSLAK